MFWSSMRRKPASLGRSLRINLEKSQSAKTAEYPMYFTETGLNISIADCDQLNCRSYILGQAPSVGAPGRPNLLESRFARFGGLSL